jgi:cytochrome P450
MQNHEGFWDDPHVFRPERFTEATPKPYTYMPFLVGPRQCIGKNFAILELKCIVAEILKRFTVAKDPDAGDIITAQAILVYSVNNTFLMSPR